MPFLCSQFYLSIFEIRTERGKAERICDLTSDGPDLCMQQSTIKGLQEVVDAYIYIYTRFMHAYVHDGRKY